MKRTLSMIALAVLTIGLLGSCSKINERLDNLEKKVSGIENEQIASINSQIDGIKTSIADLGTIRSDISSLKQSASDHSVDIFNLEEADRALADRIVNLEDYVDAVLPNYAEKEWVEATFSTLEQYEATCDTIAKIDARIGALDAKLSKDIKATADSLTKWVNKTFEGYYTAAEMDASLAQMKSDIDSARAANKISDAKADSIAGELAKVKPEVDTVKANIRNEYKAAVKAAIEESEGKLTKELTDAITEVNDKIESLVTRVDNLATEVDKLTGRVKALEEMIQSVVIVPAYSDGSVEVKDGILYLDIVVEPSDAVVGLTKDSLKVLVNEVKTKAVKVDTVSVANIKVDAVKGIVTARADISSKLPKDSKKELTVAVNVKNGLSDHTTKFYPVALSSNVKVEDKEDTTKVTISADADFPGLVIGNIVVADGFKDSKPTTIDVQGIGNVIFDTEATAKIKANAQEAGATSVLFKVEDVTTTKPVPNADVVLEVTMKTVDENGKEVFNKENADGEVTIQIPMDENVVYVNSVTLVNDAGDPIEGGVVPGSEEIENGILTFKVNHFSKYAVDYVTRAEFKEVTGVSIEPVSVTLQVGDTLRLVATIAPEDATNKKVTWSSDKTEVATVDATGKVTAVAFGEATITVTTKDGGKTSTCEVKVTETKAMSEILKTATGIPESKDLTPPANAWVNSTNPDCKAFVGIDAEGDTLFVIKKEGLSNPPAVCMDDEFEKIDDNTYKRTEPDFTFTVKMTEGKFTSLEFNTNIEGIKFLNGIYKAGNKFKAVYNTNGDANTLTFYYDAVDHSGEGITVYDNLPTAASKNTDWGYNDKRGEIKSVVIDASVADYKGLTSTAYMFQNMKAATSISGAEYLNVSNVTDMNQMFLSYGHDSESLADVPNVSNWNTEKVTNMKSMFSGYGFSSKTLADVPNVSNWNTEKVTNMSGMFSTFGHNSGSLAVVPDVKNWNTEEVTNMNYMFQAYGSASTSLNKVPEVGRWNTAKVTTMAEMFREYGAASTVLNAVPDVSGWNTINVTTMANLFQNYGKGSVDFVLDLSGWDLSKITGTNGKYVFSFTPKTFDVTIPAKTGAKSNEGDKWYYGDGTNYIAPPAGKTFTPLLLPAGALKGVFSVSATKKVHFSQGNLWADGNKALHFEANQYSSASSWDASHVSHFTWSSTVEVAVGDIYRGNYLFCDESHKVSVDGGEAIYYALSKDEWTYLFNNHSKKWVSVDGVNGYVIAPDGFSGELSDTYADDAALAAAGNLVFLPAAGYRFQKGFDFVGDFGDYWSSTAYDEDQAYYVHFESHEFGPVYDDRDYGFSVRLVTEVPAAGDPGNGTEQYKNNSNPDWFSK